MTGVARPVLTGLVLAAGASTRMGADRNKLLEVVGLRPVVRAPIDALLGAGVARVVVVTGHQAAEVEAVVAEPRVQIARHDDWRAGMGASIACGVRALAGSPTAPDGASTAPDGASTAPDGVLVCPGDLPGLTSRPVEAVVATFVRIFEREGEAVARAAIVVPEAAGRAGHPVLFGAAHLPALGRLSGDRGARALVDAAGPARRGVEVGDDAIHRDVDTPDALEAARRGD